MNSFTLGQGSLSWKAALLSCSRVSCGCAWKIQGRSLSLAPVRTVNRNRSPRLKASGRQNNVGKGSRQNRSVTSGKGLAPRLHAGVGVDRARDSAEDGLREALSGATRGSLRLLYSSACCAYNEAATWNCYEQGESNWLIKP